MNEGPGDASTLDLTDDWQAPGGPLFADDGSTGADFDATVPLRRPRDPGDADATQQLRRIDPDRSDPDGGAS